MSYLIEICCSGNNGRSPMAEAIGNRTVSERRLEGKISFISSGTKVNEIRESHGMPYERVSFILERAAKIGLAKNFATDEKRYGDDEEYKQSIHYHASQALKKLHQLESNLRRLALEEIGIGQEHYPKQTMPLDIVTLLLGMEQEHVDFARGIYRVRGVSPQISLLRDYVGRGWFPNPIGSGIETYREFRDNFQSVMPIVIEKFVLEHRL